MNQVDDVSGSPWRTLQRQLARDSRLHARSARGVERVPQATSWLIRALDRMTLDEPSH